MVRARSLTGTALVCAAFAGWLVASGCSKPRNSNTPSNNASVATPGDTANSSTYGGATPSTTKSNLNGDTSGRSFAGQSADTGATTRHHRARTSRHVRRAQTDTSSSYNGGATPMRTDTAATGGNAATRRDTTAMSGRTDTTLKGGQYAMANPSQSSTGVGQIGSTSSTPTSSACTSTSSANCVNGQSSTGNVSSSTSANAGKTDSVNATGTASAAAGSQPRSDTGVNGCTSTTASGSCSPSSNGATPTSQATDTTRSQATVAQAPPSDTSWLYGGSHAAHKDTTQTRRDSSLGINPTDTSRLGVGSSSGVCNCVTPNQPPQSNQPNSPNANCSPSQQTTCSNMPATANPGQSTQAGQSSQPGQPSSPSSCPAGQVNCSGQSGTSTTSCAAGQVSCTTAGSATQTSTYGGATGVSSDTGRNRGATGANDTSRAGGSGNLSDGQIADIVVIANTADSTAGAAAARRASSQPVKDFARQMMQDHGASNRQVKELARRVNVAPVSSDDSRNLRNDADDAMRNLQGKSGADYDRAYIDHEVDMHERVLRTLDEKLIPSADNAELKALLQQTRAVINQHLQRAREIQSSLRNQ